MTKNYNNKNIQKIFVQLLKCSSHIFIVKHTLILDRVMKQSEPLTKLLYYIKSDAQFQQQVSRFWNVFRRNTQGHLTRSDFLEVTTLIYSLLLPELNFSEHKRLAEEKVGRIVSHNNFIFDVFAQLMVQIAFQCVENIDLKSAISFLEFVFLRITDLIVVNARNNQRKILLFGIEVTIFGRQDVQKQSVEPKNQKLVPINTLYYQEKIVYDAQQIVNQDTFTTIVEFKKQEHILPLGYICDSILSVLSNNQFKPQQSYKILNQQRIKLPTIPKVTAKYDDKGIEPLKDSLLNKERMHTSFVLHKHLPSHDPKQFGNGNVIFYRFNQYLSAETYFEQLKVLEGNQANSNNGTAFFNILSRFHGRHQFPIDQINNVGQKWHRKRKANMMGEERKKNIKKVDKNPEQVIRLLQQNLLQKLKKYWNSERTGLQINFLKDKLRTSLEQDKIINLQKFLSSSDILPYDNSQPFQQDIIDYAKQCPLQILIIGRPKCGKSTISKRLATKYQILNISLENCISRIFQRQKSFQQNPPQVDQDGVAKDGLSAIQKCILEDLNNGKKINEQDVLDLLNKQLKDPITSNKGFILDLPLEYNSKDFNWVQKIISSVIYTPKIGCRYFTHIIDLQQTEQQWKYFVKGLMQKPQDYTLSSTLDRYLIVKPKPPPQQGDEEEEAGNDQDKPQPLVESALISLQSLTLPSAKNVNPIWNSPNVHYLVTHLHPRNHLKIRIAGKSINQIIQILQNRLYKIPLAKKLQGNQKQLLTAGLQQKRVYRKWSEWGTIDPVQLYKGKLISGKSQFAAQYAGRVFLFAQQKNLLQFMASTRKFLRKRPQLPSTFNIVINGPRKSGKKTLANTLSKIYGLKIVNIEQIITRKLIIQKNMVQSIPSNFDKRSNSVHLSQGEWKQFSKGGLLSAKDILPIVLFQLGIPLQKKPQDWGIQKNQQQKTQIQKQRQQKQKQDAAKKGSINKKGVNKKKQQKESYDQRPKTPPPQDLNLKDIIPKINHLNKLDEPRGYIFIGYPTNQQQLQAFKLFNIPIDKYILLTQIQSQESPQTRHLPNKLNQAQLQYATQAFTTLVGSIKQALGQQTLKQINMNDQPNSILIKVRTLIDPFYLKIDDDNLNRISSEVKQDQDDPIQLGFCGNYCPVILNQRWLIRGKQQFECGVRGQRYRCFAEKQFNIFKNNPSAYLDTKKLDGLPPRLLFMGIRGVGLKTQLIKINQKWRIPILNLKDNLLAHLQGDRLRRKTQRYYNKGFKPKEVDEQGKQIQDAQLNQQSADFDRKGKQIEVVRNVFQGMQQILINGNFFDIDQQKITTPLVELLSEARRLPEAVIILKVDQKKWLQRVFNPREIQKQHQKLVQELRQQKWKQKQEARKKAQQAGQQYQQVAAEEQDLGAPKLQQMINQRKQKLIAQRQADLAKLQQYAQAFKAANVDVIMLDCQRDINHVFDKINYSIKPYIENRIQKWQKIQMLKITPQRISNFLQNFIVKQSRFGKSNPFTLLTPPKPIPLIYKQRLYYFDTQQERDTVIQNPQILLTNRPVPQDIIITPKVFIIGKPKSGKKSLARLLQKKLGFVTVKIKKIIQQVFSLQHKQPTLDKILQHLKSGQTLTDQMIVDLIERRVQLPDCVKKGWVLVGFPANKTQAQILIKRGLLPNAVFSIQITDNQIKKRLLPMQNNSKYSYNLGVVSQRLSRINKQLPGLQNYFLNKYDNIRFIDGKISKWGIFETARDFIIQTIKSKKQLLRSLVTQQPTSARNIGLPFNAILNNLNETYTNYCLVTYKTQRQYARSALHQHPYLALYKKKIYVLASQKQYQDFVSNPDIYLLSSSTTANNAGISSFNPPQLILPYKTAEVFEKIQNKGYCVVELTKKKLQKGNPCYCVQFRDKIFGLSKANNLRLFMRNPVVYQMSKLQDKLPVQFDKKSELKKIAKKSDCTAFLEHHLGNIMMRVLAELGYRRLKYPTLSSKETALKFLAISLKANNANKDEQYRQKYKQKLQQFIKHCSYPQELRQQFSRKQQSGQKWQQWQQQNLLKLSQQYSQFMKELNSAEKASYFSKFIQ